MGQSYVTDRDRAELRGVASRLAHACNKAIRDIDKNPRWLADAYVLDLRSAFATVQQLMTDLQPVYLSKFKPADRELIDSIREVMADELMNESPVEDPPDERSIRVLLSEAASAGGARGADVGGVSAPPSPTHDLPVLQWERTVGEG